MKPIRIILVGAGYIAQRAYLPLLSQWAQVEITGIYRRSADSSKDIAPRYPTIPLATDLESLDEKEVDAAFVLTPVEFHFEICEKLLAKGIHVFVEKPPTTSSTKTRELARLAAEKDRIFMVGFNRRFAPLVTQAKPIIPQPLIRMCVVEKHRPGIQQRTTRETYQEDLIHQIDLLRYICGDLEPLTTKVAQVGPAFISGVSVLKLANSGLAILLASREAGRWQEKLSIFGEETSLELNFFSDLTIKRAQDGYTQHTSSAGSWADHLEQRGFKSQIAHFFDCIRTHQQPLTHGLEAAKSQELQESLLAIENGR